MTLYETIPDELRVYAQKPEDETHLAERRYALRITEELEHSHGVMWVGNLTTDGKIIAVVENAGRGGCNEYIIKDEDLWLTFAEDAYRAYGNSSESKDALVQLIDVLSAEVK